MIEAVVFDIGNVLIEWQPERFYDAAIGPEARAAMFAEVDLHGMNDAIDRGGDFQGTIHATAERYPRWRAEIRLWHANWIDMASPVIPRSVRLMRALRARGVPVFALTNFGIGSFAYARTRYDFLDEFDRTWVSGHMGVIKPDPQIYALVEADCGLGPGALLFTDDRADNIAAAAARGWQVHQFLGPEGWAARLVAEGLLNEREAQ
ncbi:HAD family hydrolase [Phaeovulum sp.]|uniref:HAD family hydrolase n=1 Tax=Phaeovulum sp. TaxID=2934796 RepID=UPI002730F357|nr:HAD family phosphatase [Phaeovulum sp.]MDP1668900.1 HAD family phosphatase [Phaeovulum sp.]MDP2061560.1 HAD family phosphatase [Phaeovulum sp.]MDZ4119171.1 HAD family phosphatase [Phaeovulum sp.]